MQSLVTVFGGGGFVGRHTVRALAKQGHRIRVAVRRPHLIPELKVMGDVGQIELFQANIRDQGSIDRALQGATGVVNLVGVLYQTGRQTFQSLQADGARSLAISAAKAGVDRFVQVSAIGASATSPAKYARAKAEGEAAVLKAVPTATVLRPSIVFGPEDDFFNRFAAMAAVAPALPLIGGGKTLFQPVYVADVAKAIMAARENPAHQGKTFELGGPSVYSFKRLLEIVRSETDRNPLLLPVPWALAELIGSIGDLQTVIAPVIPPVLTTDQVRMLRDDNVVSKGALGLSDLGIESTPVESVVPDYLWRFRPGGQFGSRGAAAPT